MRSTGKRRRKSPFLVLTVVILIIVGIFFGMRLIEKTFYPRDYAELVQKYSVEYGVDEKLIFSVINCESSFNKDAVSNVGAKGLMQMGNDTFDFIQKKEGVKELMPPEKLFEPDISIHYGTALLKRHLDEFETVPEAVAAYHAGASCVRNWLKDERYSKNGKTLDEIPYTDTKKYVENVTKNLEKYQKLYYEK